MAKSNFHSHENWGSFSVQIIRSLFLPGPSVLYKEHIPWFLPDTENWHTLGKVCHKNRAVMFRESEVVQTWLLSLYRCALEVYPSLRVWLSYGIVSCIVPWICLWSAYGQSFSSVFVDWYISEFECHLWKTKSSSNTESNKL